ncbi:hypothetical protein [Flavitalea sp.]
MFNLKELSGIISAGLLIFVSQSAYAQNAGRLEADIQISFGHTAPKKTSRSIQLKGSTTLSISNIKGSKLERNDKAGEQSAFNCGAGDVDELITHVAWTTPSATPLKVAQHKDDYSINGDGMWGYLLEKGSPGQIARLQQDQWNQPDAPMFTIQLNAEGTEGFSVSMENLLKYGAMWLPEHDVFIAIAGKGTDFKKHLASLKGQRTLDVVRSSPEASLDQFKKRWADFGNPNDWKASWQTRYMGTTGHLTVTAATHGSIYKFAVDRWANLRPDFASPHRFRLDFLLPGSEWKGQKIQNGLPVVVTNLQKNEQQFEVEQFASTFGDVSAAISGYVRSVMLTRVKVSGKAGNLNFGFSFNNEQKDRKLSVANLNGKWNLKDDYTNETLLSVEGPGLTVTTTQNGLIEKGQQVTFNITGNLANGETKEVVLKLPAPAVSAQATAVLNGLKYDAEKTRTIAYWEQWLTAGAQFIVPEQKVNELYRASLWHSLILPRHTINDNNQQHMDLPYANTAYGQKKADWPINQAVYVDYMIYGLRGYEKVAENELKAMFQSQQQPDGRIGGFANWGVYSPGHLYTIAQNYLLSGNKEEFGRLLPQSLKALDWCLRQINKSDSQTNRTGLILGALNDLTHAEREWAFTQAYYVAGLEQFARALSRYGHQRADEVKQVAAKMKKDVVTAFAGSSVKSPVVQLADGSWTNYVPTDAMTPRRMMEQWYPTDVDCGPLHLSRLGVFEPYSWMTTAMLNDHEDNLFLLNNGAANEPVYVQQGNTYLLRDDPKGVIRSFYSMMACAFSHEQLTSLEHRWAWGQYYGPPSTDGAWFELYRRMLINEFGDDTLMIGQAVPREWLKTGKQIEVKNAPTNFGPLSLSFRVENANEIKAEVNLSDRNPPKQLLIRFRHQQEKSIRSVTVNGKPWRNFDSKKEFVIIPEPSEKNYVILAKF